MIGLAEKSELKEKIVQVDANKAIRYMVVEEEIDLARLKDETNYAKARLSELPPKPSDSDLLAWAKDNYPQMDYSVEKAMLEETISNNEAVLNSLR